MQRNRLLDFRLSRGPEICGITRSNVGACAAILNAAQQNLVFAKECGNEGWNGAWAEMVFSVSREQPYITCPRGVARIEAIDVCDRPVPLHNQFFEYMRFGNGRMSHDDRWRGRCDGTSVYSRNNAVTFTDLNGGPQNIQIFAVNPADVGTPNTPAARRVLLQGLDQNGATIYSMDGPNRIEGEFVTLQSPYAMSVNTFRTLTGIQKDITQGPVQVFQSDPTWGIAEIILTMEPSETTAWYRRYYMKDIPRGCCPVVRPVWVNNPPPECGCSAPKPFVLVTALVKLDLIPVVTDTDYCLIQNLEALIEEAQSVKLREGQTASAIEIAKDHHTKAIQLLIGECNHFYGKNQPEVLFKPFGRDDRRLTRLMLR